MEEKGSPNLLAFLHCRGLTMKSLGGTQWAFRAWQQIGILERGKVGGHLA